MASVKPGPVSGPGVGCDLIAVLQSLHERGVTVTVTNCPPIGGFGVWIGDPDNPQARRIFRHDELAEVADWLLATAEPLQGRPDTSHSL